MTIDLNEIPVRVDIFSYSIDIIIEGIEYTLLFDYNFRDSFWYMGIKDFIEGQKIVHGQVLFNQYGYKEGFPQVNFVVVDTSGNRNDPTLENFGDSVKLYYI